MGGAAKAIEGAAKSGLQVATGGVYDPNTGKIAVGKSQLQNVYDGVSGQTLQNELAPKPPGAPKAEDPAVQAARAKAEAEAKFEEEVGTRAKGLTSTVLGGSTSTDANALKKKKLLGE